MYITPIASQPILSAQLMVDGIEGQIAPLTAPILRVALHDGRALGVGGEPSSTANVLPMPTMEVSGTVSSSSPSPFFTTLSQQSDGDSGSSSGRSENLTKTILEWVFAIAALVVIAALTAWRYAKLRRSRQPLNAFLPRVGGRFTSPSSRPQNVPRTTGLPRVPTSGEPQPLTMSAALFYPPSLSCGRYASLMEPMPAVIASATGATERVRGRRAARGQDIDNHGRRTGPRDADDDDGDDKDELPAYDNLGGPPKYVDLDTQAHMQVLGVNVHVGGTHIPLNVFRTQLSNTPVEAATQQPHTQPTSDEGAGLRTIENDSAQAPPPPENDVPRDQPPPFTSPSRPNSPPTMPSYDAQTIPHTLTRRET